MAHFLSLPIELRNQVEAELPFNALLALRSTCHLFYNEITPQIWQSFLKPEFRRTLPDPKTTFYADINHVQPCFWHLHPQGIEAYQKLKAIANNSRWTSVLKLYDIEKLVNANHITAMITVAHPIISKVVLEALFTEYGDGTHSFSLSEFEKILKVHPEVVIFTLRSTEFRNTFVSRAYEGIVLLRKIALHYSVIDHTDIQWVFSMDPTFRNTCIQLSDLILSTLLERQQAKLIADECNKCLPTPSL